MIRAALHLHSTYSDGEFTLVELRDIFRSAGCRVVGVTDHADAFDEAALHRYTEECAQLSDDHLLVLPGLEYGCHKRMHILGYGVTAPVSTQEPEDVIRHIAGHDGVSVIAHPMDEHFDWIDGFEMLPNGVEAWNSKYDGRSAPRPQTFGLITRLRERKPDLRAFFGIDLHWRRQYRELFTLIDADGPAVTRESILERLREGRFSGAAGTIRLPSTAAVTDSQLKRFGSANRRARRLRQALRQAKRIADALGIRPPDSLKAQMRRLF